MNELTLWSRLMLERRYFTSYLISTFARVWKCYSSVFQVASTRCHKTTHVHTFKHICPLPFLLAMSGLFFSPYGGVKRFGLILFALTAITAHLSPSSPPVGDLRGSGEMYGAKCVCSQRYGKTRINGAIRTPPSTLTVQIPQRNNISAFWQCCASPLPASLFLCTTWRAVLFVFLSLPHSVTLLL